MNDLNLVTCLSCGWVHFSYTRQKAQEEVDSFNRYFDTLTAEKQQSYYGGRRSAVVRYEHCGSCGGTYLNFRPAVDGDCPEGCTISPIIHFSEPLDFDESAEPVS